MIEKILKAVKSSNKKTGRNITLGVIVGFILTGGIVYSEEISLKKKAVYDEEIKWLWSFEKGDENKRSRGNTGGGELSPEPEVIPPKKDEIPWEHDPDGVIEDGVEQDSIDIYTGILKREWNKEKQKWEVVGLQDENKDGIADIYNPDGDFDGDGIENKYDKNWALNDGKQNDHFISSNGLGYVDSGNIIKILNKNDWNADEIKSHLYSEGQQDVYKSGIKNLEDTDIKTITKLDEYNEEYNGENNVVNSFDNNNNFENKLKEIGQDKLDEYYSNTKLGKAKIVNKGQLELSGMAGQHAKDLDELKIYNYGKIINMKDQNKKRSIRYGENIETSKIFNFGSIFYERDDEELLLNAQHIFLNDKESNANEIVNYGGIHLLNKTRGKSVIGQLAVSNSKFEGSLLNYGNINIEVSGEKAIQKNNEIVGQRIQGTGSDINAKLYNYGAIKLALTGTFKSSMGTDEIIGQEIYSTSSNSNIVNNEDKYKNYVYNYGIIKVENFGENEIPNIYGQVIVSGSSGNKIIENQIFNYGIIEMKSGRYSMGQYLSVKKGEKNIKKNEAYNYGIINIDKGLALYGQYIDKRRAAFEGESNLYNYGIINILNEDRSSGETFGQYARGENINVNNYGKIRVNGKTSDTAGIKVSLGAKGFNYGIIEVDNQDSPGTGMIASGVGSEVFNYGSIIVTKENGRIEDGIDTAYMRATDGGKVYNYGWLELKDSLDALTIGEGVSSSTKAGYRSAGDFDLKGEMKIMAETGKGDIYSKENFITAGGNGKEGNISGLENLTSSGVYEVSTVERKGEDGENVVDLVMNKTKNIEDLEKDSNTGRMVKELKLDNAVYGKDSEFAKNNKEFSEMVSRKVSNGETLEDLLGLEYANLNGQIIESGKVLLENQEKVVSADRTYLSGQFNKENNFDAVIINPQNESKIGIFHLNSDKDLDSHASGTYRYDLESTTLILQNNKNYMIGMNYSKLDYKNRNSDMKKTSVFAGHNYTKSLGDISEYRNYLNGTLTFNSMDRNGKRDNFKSYTLNMRNEYVRELDTEGLTYSEFTAGLKTTVFGHEKIKEHGADLTSDRNIEVKKKIGISNEVNLGILMNKSYELGKNKGKNNFGISTYLEYKKELMPIEDWRDEFTIGTGSYAKYNKPVKEHDLGVGLVVISARYEIKDELSGTLSFSADTLGDTMTTFKIEYKF